VALNSQKFRHTTEWGTAARWREVVAGGPGDRFRDQHGGEIRAGHQRPQGDARPAVADGEGPSRRWSWCASCTGFKRIEPGIDIGVDLGEECRMAERQGGNRC